MTQLEKMEIPVAVTMPSGNWDVIQGLLVREIIRAEDRLPMNLRYLENLRRMRESVIQAQDKAEKRR